MSDIGGQLVSQAFIQELGNGRLGQEERLVAEELDRRGIPVTFYTAKRIRRRQLPLDGESLVVGDLPCIIGALKQLAIPLPAPNDYPASLGEFLHRRIWRSTLKELELKLRNSIYTPVFAKPAARCKRFAGRVFESESDLDRLGGVSRQEKIWCSEAVTWLSEYRIYVVSSEIRSVDWYAGDRDLPVDLEVVRQAINTLDRASASYAGYAIDFGVLASGETALIELNDGLAIGAYNISGKNYTDLILARWEELLAGRMN